MIAPSVRTGALIFTVGAACGAAGLLAWQGIRENTLVEARSGPAAFRGEGQVRDPDVRVARRIGGQAGTSTADGGTDAIKSPSRTGSPDVAEAGSDKSGAGLGSPDNGVAEVLIQMGAAAADGKVRSRVASLREKLDLTAPQEREVAAILAETQSKQQEAVRAFLERRATIQMLPLMDGHDPDGEAAIVALLDDSQREAYAAYRVEQEAERIEMKANKELVELQQMLDLSPEQKDLVFDLFTELARGEKPGGIDPSVTVDQFTSFLDESLGVRREAMGEILTPAQAAIYGEQLANFRNLVLGSLGGQP